MSPPAAEAELETTERNDDTMKLVTAIIKPFKLEDVEESLRDLDVQGMTVTEVRGFRPPGWSLRGVPRRRVPGELPAEAAVRSSSPTKRSTPVVDAIVHGAQTGKIGDGKVWVTDVERAVRVRTGEEGHDALN